MTHLWNILILSAMILRAFFVHQYSEILSCHNRFTFISIFRTVFAWKSWIPIGRMIYVNCKWKSRADKQMKLIVLYSFRSFVQLLAQLPPFQNRLHEKKTRNDGSFVTCGTHLVPCRAWIDLLFIEYYKRRSAFLCLPEAIKSLSTVFEDDNLGQLPHLLLSIQYISYFTITYMHNSKTLRIRINAGFVFLILKDSILAIHNSISIHYLTIYWESYHWVWLNWKKVEFLNFVYQISFFSS